MGGLYSHTTRATGTILTANIYNADNQNHIDNQTPQMTDDYSASIAQMQSTRDPYPGDAESLAISSAEEFESIRYVLKEIIGNSQWYVSEALLKLSGGTMTGKIVLDGNATAALHPVPAQQIQAGDLVYAVVAGTDTYTVTYVPVVAALTTGMVLRGLVTNANTSTTPSLNVDSRGAKTIKRPGGAALSVGDIPAGHLAEFWYDGTDMILLNPALYDYSIRDVSRGLVVKNNTTNPTYQLDTDADEIILHDSNSISFRATSINLTADITASGANGLDTGSEANSTWYYAWVIYNGTTVASLLSTSSTAPTMPSGYTYKALVGAIYNDSGGDFDTMYQVGSEVWCTRVQVLNNGSSGTYASVSLSAALPATAKKGKFQYNAQSPSTSIWRGIFAADSSGLGEVSIAGRADAVDYGGSPFEMLLKTAQTVYYKELGLGGTVDLDVNGWEY